MLYGRNSCAETLIVYEMLYYCVCKFRVNELWTVFGSGYSDEQPFTFVRKPTEPYVCTQKIHVGASYVLIVPFLRISADHVCIS